MSPPTSKKQLREIYAAKTRTLAQAAQAASVIAAAEHLPINAAQTGDTERWHRENILKIVPVYGTRNRRSERVPVTAHLDGDRATAGIDEWSDLKVMGTDFQRYLDWLHSVW
jgi:phage repressor protein C with HTH and peptisase S24 domain